MSEINENANDNKNSDEKGNDEDKTSDEKDNDENASDKKENKEPSQNIKEIIEEEANSDSSADDCCVCPCCCCCFCTCRRKRQRRKRELMSAYIRRRLNSKVGVADGDTWSLNNVRRDVYYEEYQRLKALQVQKEKAVHEMFLEDLENKKEEKLKLQNS